MLSRSLRSSRYGVAQLCRPSANVARRGFAITAVRGDLVQDMFIRELKAYKTPAVKASDADAHVLKFSTPKAPKSPEESNLAEDLSAYEAQQVDVEGQAEPHADGSATAHDDMFEDDLGLDEDEPAKH